MFDHARFQQETNFETTRFERKAGFVETAFRAVDFAKTGKVASSNGTDSLEQFGGRIDLRGCTYDRIQVEWKSLLRMKNGQSRVEYDRQPFAQLEKTIRNMGHDDQATKIYLERRRVERSLKFASIRSDAWFIRLLDWLRDNSYRFLAGYGVRTYQVYVYSSILLLIGFFAFSQPDAIQLKPESQPWLKVAAGQTQAPKPAPDPLDVLGVTLRQFLPGVDIPLGSAWIPSETPIKVPCTQLYLRPSCFALFLLRIPGWLLVPIGVLVLTGILRRVAS